MFSRLKIRPKIILVLTFIAILTLGVMGYFAFTIGVDTLETEAFNKLTAVREMKAGQIEDYFQLIFDQIRTLSEDRMIIDAMHAFEHTHGVGDQYLHERGVGILLKQSPEFVELWIRFLCHVFRGSGLLSCELP